MFAARAGAALRHEPMSADPSDRERALALTPVSPDVAARLDRFVDLLLQTQVHTNLIAPSTISTIWTRHVADSLQLLKHAPDAKIWMDFGSGAGFPGLVIAAALAGVPGSLVHLIESTKKKAAFLSETARAIGAPVQVHPVRIEDFVNKTTPLPDVVTARALAPLDKLLVWAHPILSRGVPAFFMKGQDVEAELTEASKSWTIDTSLIPSLTDPRGRIVHVRSLKRRKSPP
jgi:16S rRNA (guanine527-N7)-methyltransferase